MKIVSRSIPKKEILKIAENFNLEVPNDIYLGTKRVGFYASRVKRTREDFFTDLDLEFFHSIAHKSYGGLND